jgi:SCP-2 sterol transfer family
MPRLEIIVIRCLANAPAHIILLIQLAVGLAISRNSLKESGIVVACWVCDRRSTRRYPSCLPTETIYVIPGSDAETYVARRFPNKTVKLVSSGIRPISIAGFLFGLPLLFQRNQSEGLNAIYHFTFTGSEVCEATITIQNKVLQLQTGHMGKADIAIIADSKTWIGFLCKEQNIIWALMRRKIRVKGSIKLLQAFGKCFPS